MSAIYLALAETTYEGFDVICAFDDRTLADAFVESCRGNRYEGPQCPSITLEDGEFEAAWKEFQAAREAWIAAHPAGEYAERDHFSVHEVELRHAIGRES